MKAALTATVLALLATDAALAQTAPMSPLQACRSDAIQHCRSVRPGGGRGIDCLEAHKDQLSTACKAALPLARQCVDEVRKLCDASGNTDATAVRQCATQHATELSPACRDNLPRP